MKKTVGQIAQDLSSKESGFINPMEIAQARTNDYLQSLQWCVEHALKKVPCSDKCPSYCKDKVAFEGDFFVEVNLKKEKFAKVMRDGFSARETCPLPFYDQTVYRYNSKKEDIEYIWTVPDMETCLIFEENVNRIAPEEHALLKMVLMYHDGQLRALAKKLNGEKQSAGVALEGF
jgi:hypothetical protein